MIIDKSKYEGYIWESDKRDPELLPSAGTINTDNVGNPFVIEGQLVDLGKTQSLSIKMVDGKYIVKEYKLSDYDDCKVEDYEYIPNRMPGVERLCFKRAWREKKDDMCEGWNVLQPAELVFVGLKKHQQL